MNPNLRVLKHRIQLLYETSERIAIMGNKYELFRKTWEEFKV